MRYLRYWILPFHPSCKRGAQAIHHGVQWERISTNVTFLVSPPRVKTTQLDPPSPDNCIWLSEVATVPGHPNGLRAETPYRLAQGPRDPSTSHGQ